MIQLSPANSKCGPGAHPKRYAAPGWHAAGEIMQTADEAHAEDHDFVRPGTFEPDQVAVDLDGTRLHLEPGQRVIPHGIDRGLTTGGVNPPRRPP